MDISKKIPLAVKMQAVDMPINYQLTTYERNSIKECLQTEGAAAALELAFICGFDKGMRRYRNEGR